MLSLKEAANVVTEKSNGKMIPKAGCSYKEYWLISTYPKGEDPNDTYPDGIIAVKKSDGSLAVFDPLMDMEGFQSAIKSATKL